MPVKSLHFKKKRRTAAVAAAKPGDLAKDASLDTSDSDVPPVLEPISPHPPMHKPRSSPPASRSPTRRHRSPTRRSRSPPSPQFRSSRTRTSTQSSPEHSTVVVRAPKSLHLTQEQDNRLAQWFKANPNLYDLKHKDYKD